MKKKTIEVSLSRIYQQLNKNAIERASKAVPDITINNMAFNSENEFLGEGNYLICARSTRMMSGAKTTLPKKSYFLKALNIYVETFARDGIPGINSGGKKVVKITEGDLGVLRRNDVTESTMTTDIDIMSVYDSPMIRNTSTSLIEALFVDEASSSTPFSPSSVPPTSAELSTTVVDPDVVGYAVPYEIHLNGYKWTTDRINKAIAAKKSFFAGALADLRNFKFKNVFGREVQIGKVFDPDAWKDFIGRPDLDIETVTSNVKSVITHDFTGSNPLVKVYGVDEFKTLAQSQHRYPLDVARKIEPFTNLLTIFIQTDDNHFKTFNDDRTALAVVAAEVTKSLGTADRLVNGNKVSDKDVILLRNFVQRYKTADIYKYNKRNYRDPDDHDDTIPPPRSSRTSTRIPESFVVDTLLEMLFEATGITDEKILIHRIDDCLQGYYVDAVRKKQKQTSLLNRGLIKIAKKTDVMDFCLKHNCGTADLFAGLKDDYVIICWQKRPNTDTYTMHDGKVYKPGKLQGSLGQSAITDDAIQKIFSKSVGFEVTDIKKVHLDGKSAPTNIAPEKGDLFSTDANMNTRFLGYNSMHEHYHKIIDKATGKRECDQYPAVADVYFASIDLSAVGENPTPPGPTPPDPDPTPPGPTPDPKLSDYSDPQISEAGNMFIIPLSNLKHIHNRKGKDDMHDGNQIKHTASNDRYEP